MNAAPEAIGRYRILRPVGRGAMGLVYLAHDPVIDRNVAIKLVRADLLEDSDRDEFLERFRREAQAAARCMHPNIVTVFDFALHEANPFIAMEFVDGASLAQRFPRGAPVPPSEAADIVLQILAALEAAHGQGIVHRDIKPANILLTQSGAVKITDFGIARLALPGLTQTGAMVGTLSYMAPEQCRGEAVDHRADLFATACILYELLLGTRPFPGDTEAGIMRRLLQEPPLVPQDHALPPALLSVLTRGLEKAPGARFPSGAAMADAIRQALGEPDATVFQPRLVPGAASAPACFDPAVLAHVERQLAGHLGPIARALVQSAARRAPDLEALRDMLAASIETGKEREEFLRTSVGLTRIGGGAVTQEASVISEAERSTAQRELAVHLGPIASVLVRKALPRAASLAELWQALALHIETPAEKAAFLRKMPGGEAKG